MAVAYHILAHRNPAQVARLIDAIWSTDNVYIVHYDRRRPSSEHAALRESQAGRHNVALQKPTPVLWGRYSLYRAQHEGIRLALESAQHWTHWFNLSGQCYPLVPQHALFEELEKHRETSFCRHFRPLVAGDWENPEWRITGRFIDSPALEWWLRLPWLGRRLRRLFGGENSLPRLPIARRSLPADMTWYGGDNWVGLSRAAATYLVRSEKAAQQIAAFRHGAFPEESIFQTVLMNGPFAPTVVNDHRRHINWHKGIGSPKIFELNDRGRILEATNRGAFFARKFDPEHDSKVIDWLDERRRAAGHTESGAG